MSLRGLRGLIGGLVLAATLVASGCNEPKPFVRTFRATNRSQLIGGSAAIGDVGDYVIENDQVRFVVLGGHSSPGPGIFGGSLADADLQRPEPEFRHGNGLDSMSEIFPMVNLTTPNPEENEVSIEADGEDGTEAVLRVSAPADNYLRALELLKQGLGVPMEMRMTTRYRLVPGSRAIEIETSIDFDSNEGQRTSFAMPPLIDAPDIFGTILRLPGGSWRSAPGAVAGDFLFYGNKTEIFSPGYGFDIDHKIREVFNGGCDTLNVPVGLDAVAAEGDRVSYAYASADPEGQTFVPLFASSFTAVVTHKVECDSSMPCLGSKRFTYRRLLAVGDGDAASAMAAIHEARSTPIGTLRGQLRDRRDATPVSGARVFVLRDPGTEVASDGQLQSEDPDALLARIYEANQAATRRCPEGEVCGACSGSHDPYGAPGVLTSMRTDRGTDRVLDGDFEATLPPGTYLLVARTTDRPASRPVRVRVNVGQVTRSDLWIEPPGELEFRIRDERGRPSPGKVTLGRCMPECLFDGDCGSGETCDVNQRRCFPKDGCGSGECAPYETCTPGGCRCNPTTPMDVALGDPLLPDRIVGTAFANAAGVVHMRVRPGTYEAIVSRGLEYDLARQNVTLEAGRPITREAAIHRVVDSTGWVSADFHVHGQNSHDAAVRHEERVRSMMGEGIELLSSSDHDWLTDFRPTVRALRAEEFIQTQVGLESTTIETGHFIGAPLVYDELAAGPDVLPRTAGAPDWRGLAPGSTGYCDTNENEKFDRDFERLVPLGDPDRACGDAPVRVDPGIMGRLRSLGLFGPRNTVITVPHPRDGFFGYFEQYALDGFSLALNTSLLEVLNPVVRPEFFSADFDAIELFNGKRYDLIRTPSIEEISDFGRQLEELRADELTTEEYERRTTEISDRWIRKILERTPSEQWSIRAATNQLSCTATPCDALGGCPTGEMCVDDPAFGRACLRVCSVDSSCGNVYGGCDMELGVCRRSPEAPCTDHRGIIDDWFRLLDSGVKVTGVGNSDTHSLIASESGLPRNYVRSSNDEPRAIDIGEIAQNVIQHEVVSSYGPFIRMDANGVGIGGTLAKPDSVVSLHVAVESPLWFDVDRLEVYRNSELWRVIEAGHPDPACAVVDDLPNRRVIHFDCTFEDTPDRDVWYVATAMGLHGKDLRPVYTSVPILRLEIGDITGRALGALSSIGFSSKPPAPRQGAMIPIAITNPIWVDLDDNGFDAPVPAALSSPFAVRAASSQPLSTAALTSPLLGRNDDDDEQNRRRQIRAALRRRLEHAFEVLHHRPPSGE